MRRKFCPEMRSDGLLQKFCHFLKFFVSNLLFIGRFCGGQTRSTWSKSGFGRSLLGFETWSTKCPPKNLEEPRLYFWETWATKNNGYRCLMNLAFLTRGGATVLGTSYWTLVASNRAPTHRGRRDFAQAGGFSAPIGPAHWSALQIQGDNLQKKNSRAW